MWPWASCAGLLDVLIWAAARATWRQRICGMRQQSCSSCLNVVASASGCHWQGKCDHKKCKFCWGLSRCAWCLYLFVIQISSNFVVKTKFLSLKRCLALLKGRLCCLDPTLIPRPLQSAAEPVRLKIQGPWQAVDHYHHVDCPQSPSVNHGRFWFWWVHILVLLNSRAKIPIFVGLTQICSSKRFSLV